MKVTKKDFKKDIEDLLSQPKNESESEISYQRVFDIIINNSMENFDTFDIASRISLGLFDIKTKYWFKYKNKKYYLRTSPGVVLHNGQNKYKIHKNNLSIYLPISKLKSEMNKTLRNSAFTRIRNAIENLNSILEKIASAKGETAQDCRFIVHYAERKYRLDTVKFDNWLLALCKKHSQNNPELFTYLMKQARDEVIHNESHLLYVKNLSKKRQVYNLIFATHLLSKVFSQEQGINLKTNSLVLYVRFLENLWGLSIESTKGYEIYLTKSLHSK